MNRRRRHQRKWRLRGRKGQVAAVATILGLLIVVVYIANYLTATLPGQMSVNDLNHVILVENQLGHLQALLHSASTDGAVGAELTQPITLGSAGQPPFADADSGTIGPALNGSYFQLNTTLQGPLTYTPPTGGIANTGNHPAGCTIIATGVDCTAASNLVYNFSATTGPTTYLFTITASGTYLVNVTDSGSTLIPASITWMNSGTGAVSHLLVIGNNDTITVSSSAASTEVIEIVGNYDTVDVSNTNTLGLTVYAVGIHNEVDVTSSNNGMTLVATFFGSTDSVVLGTIGGTTQKFHVYFNGFQPWAPTEYCPVDNLAATSDTVTGGTSGTYSVTYNDTAAASIAPPAPWGGTSITPSILCPFYAHSVIPFNLAQGSAGFDVHFANTYIPPGDAAFDQGAVIYAQAGGIPAFIDPPSISATTGTGGAVTSVFFWVPVFVGVLSTDAGLSTAMVATRLLSVNTISLTPQSSLGIDNSTNIVVTIHTSFAQAWTNFFNTTTPFQNDWSCAPAGSAPCTGTYASGGPFGTVVLTIPTGTLLDSLEIQLATFNVSLV
ncbi:MAG: hypothetical protein WB947_06745 [Thermoplasmata archaeon]